jgi:F0F1-type ATP synthase assembly protein I
MGESPRNAETTTKNKGTTHAVLLLATTALDATWRTIVPGVVGTVLGLLADHALHTTPFIMIAGLVLGMALSALLIYRLLKGATK